MNTNGYDTVFAAEISAINKALARSTSHLLTSFDFQDRGFTVNGQFGSWKIAPGGSGRILILEVPIAAGSLDPGSGTPIDLAGIAVSLRISLDLLPSPSEPGSLVLQFNFREVGDATSLDQAGCVTPYAVSDPQERLTPLQESALGHAIATCLVENADEISFVFATLNPMAASDVRWLKPAFTAYAYNERVGTEIGLLAVLCLASKPSGTPPPAKVDPALLTDSEQIGLAIAPELFMANVFAPALAGSFGVDSSCFSVSPGGSVRATRHFHLKSVSKAGETYTPVVSSLTAEIVDDHISVALSGNCNMHMGIHMDFNANSNLGLSYDSPSKSLRFRAIGSPVFHKSVHIPWYDHLLDFISLIAEVILQITVAAISSELGGGIASEAKNSDLAGVASDLVEWADSGVLAPNQAGLASCFYLRGGPSPKPD